MRAFVNAGSRLAGTATARVSFRERPDIDGCDALLVMYVKPSVGTSMEVLYAHERGKRIVVVHEPEAVLSPWLLYHSHGLTHSIRAACDLISGVTG